MLSARYASLICRSVPFRFKVLREWEPQIPIVRMETSVITLPMHSMRRSTKDYNVIFSSNKSPTRCNNATSFFRSNDIDVTKNTYIPSLTVTEIMGEKYGLLAVPRIVHFKRDGSSLHCACSSLSRQPSQGMRRGVSYVKYLEI